jgi:hypothetical protein
MAKRINFPTGSAKSPLSVGTQHTIGDRTWEWDGKGWKKESFPSTSISNTESTTEPSSPTNGDIWKDTSTDRRYIYISEESVWVEL